MQSAPKKAKKEQSITPDKSVSTSNKPLSVTPNKDRYFQELYSCIDRNSAKGHLLIKGLEKDDDDDGDDGDEEDENTDLTIEELNKLCIILITAERDKALKKAMKFANPEVFTFLCFYRVNYLLFLCSWLLRFLLFTI